MKKSFFGFVAAVVLVGVGVASYASQTKASTDPFAIESRILEGSASEAQEVMQKVISAVKAHDVEVLMQYTHDMRYESEADRKNHFEQQHDDTKDIEMGAVQAIDSSLVMITINSTGSNDETVIMTLPVYKLDGEWKVIMGGTSHRGYKYESN